MCVTTIHGGLNINSVPRACRRLLILATTDCASRAHSAIDWRCIIGVRAQLAKAIGEGFGEWPVNQPSNCGYSLG